MKEKEIGCDNCYYSFFDEKAYPCSLCIRGIERTDKWQPNKKTKERIVRCRECRKKYSCVIFEGIANEDGFCSLGETEKEGD